MAPPKINESEKLLQKTLFNFEVGLWIGMWSHLEPKYTHGLKGPVRLKTHPWRRRQLCNAHLCFLTE